MTFFYEKVCIVYMLTILYNKIKIVPDIEKPGKESCLGVFSPSFFLSSPYDMLKEKGMEGEKGRGRNISVREKH